MRPSYTELAAAQRQAEKARGKAAAAESALNKAQQVVEREEELLHMANGAKADVRMMQARAELAEHTAKAQAQRADRAEKALNACRKEFYAYRKAGREVRKTIAMLTFAVLMVGAAVYAIVTIGSAPRWAVMMPFLGGVAMGAALLISDCAEMGKEAGEHSERGTGEGCRGDPCGRPFPYGEKEGAPLRHNRGAAEEARQKQEVTENDH